MKKFFLITIDTEGDNLWGWKKGDEICTKNVNYLSRFQKLCETYGFKPVWLSNYEMISDPAFVEFICDVENRKVGELGMHLHAWNNPPEYNLETFYSEAPYLIEYPFNVMENKLSFLLSFVKEKTGITPISHRAGRWAMNDDYFDLLIKYGFKVDCSVTPHIDWSAHVGETKGSRGANYSFSSEKPFWFNGYDGRKRLLEVPVTIRKTKNIIFPESFSIKNIAKSLYKFIKRSPLWLRPTGRNLKEMLYIVRIVEKSDDDYLMFMLHSSELMPGGSPNFKNEKEIEKLYKDIDVLFRRLSKQFIGITLRDYFAMKKGD